MTTPPARPKIFHITHVDNLRSIVAAGELLSDASMIARGGPQSGIGMSTIKQRRLALPVTCHANDHVGDYVPFYFCPRSIMLFVEFLVHGSFPWNLVEALGVISQGVRGQAEAAIAVSPHQPAVNVRPKWYY